MVTIHLLHGFIVFGKTTTAKKIAKEYSAIRLTRDDFNTKIFGRNPVNDGFGEFLSRTKELIWKLTAETIANGIDVVIDHGHWTKKERVEIWQQSKQLTPNVIFHVIQCDMVGNNFRTAHKCVNMKYLTATKYVIVSRL